MSQPSTEFIASTFSKRRFYVSLVLGILLIGLGAFGGLIPLFVLIVYLCLAASISGVIRRFFNHRIRKLSLIFAAHGSQMIILMILLTILLNVSEQSSLSQRIDILLQIATIFVGLVWLYFRPGRVPLTLLTVQQLSNLVASIPVFMSEVLSEQSKGIAGAFLLCRLLGLTTMWPSEFWFQEDVRAESTHRTRTLRLATGWLFGIAGWFLAYLPLSNVDRYDNGSAFLGDIIKALPVVYSLFLIAVVLWTAGPKISPQSRSPQRALCFYWIAAILFPLGFCSLILTQVSGAIHIEGEFARIFDNQHLLASYILLAFLCVGAGIISGFSSLRYRAYRLSTVKEILSANTNHIFLYLRSFNEEDKLRVAIGPHIQGMAEFLSFGGISLDSVIEKVLSSSGQLIALAKPGDSAVRDGATREEQTNEDWQSRICAHLEKSDAVFLVSGSSPGLLWELSYIRENAFVHKLAVVMPPLRGKQLRLHWNAFCAAAEVAGYPRPSHKRPSSVLLLYCEKGAWVAICDTYLYRQTALGYTKAISQFLQLRNPMIKFHSE